jgi:hypothetical protein
MALWHLASQTNTRLLLWRTSPASFRVVQYDELAAVLTNYDYFLFDAKCEAVLRQLAGQVDICPVIVTDGVRQLTWDHYLEAKIHRLVDTSQIATLTPPGLEMYRFGEESIFVSEALKAALERVSPSAFYFSTGLSEFAA